MISFKDLNGFNVELTFGAEQMGIEIGHVLVVLKHDGKWLLTRHPRRGVEFPGGKKELGESIEEAAIRETIEETGVTITNLERVATYIVHDKVPFCKAVFTGRVLRIDGNYELHETEGIVWMTDRELDLFEDLSFYMKDEGMSAIRKRVDHRGS